MEVQIVSTYLNYKYTNKKHTKYKKYTDKKNKAIAGKVV